MWTGIKAVVGGLFGLGGKYLDHKAQEKQAIHNQKMSVIQNTSDWESLMAESTKESWKDEYWTLVLSLPLWGIFYAVMFESQQLDMFARIDLAFKLFSDLPDWYQYLLFLVISASFGIRGADKLMKLRK